MSADVEAVLPCPFCRGPGTRISCMGDWVSREVGYEPDGCRIICLNGRCGQAVGRAYYGPDKDAQAIAAWNRRATPESAKGPGLERAKTLEEAARDRAVLAYLLNCCTYSYGEGGAEPSPPEFGIEWGWQASTPARPGLREQLDADALAYFRRYVNEMDPGDEPTDWDRECMAHARALSAAPDAAEGGEQSPARETTRDEWARVAREQARARATRPTPTQEPNDAG